MKSIKALFELRKQIKEAPVHLAWYQILHKIVDFATDVQQHGKPMLTKIAAVNMSKDNVYGDFDVVSIWAGVGEANPIERCKHLKAQNTMMKDLLRKCLLDGITDDTKINIPIILDTFE